MVTDRPLYGHGDVDYSTYDGLCYDAVRVAGLLGASVPRLHFDESVIE